MAFTSDSLAIFLAVLDAGSFSAAARKLGRVPSAVSMAIAQLEAELDLPLFDRATRKALPTNAALALEPQARQVICQLNLLDAQALQLHKGLEKRLTIAMAPELQTGRWSQPLEILAQAFPSLEIEVRSATQTEAIRLLHDGSVQLALVFERPGIDERESFLEAGSQLLVAVASPRHPAGQNSGTPLPEEAFAEQRQIIVASGKATGSDPRMVLSRRIWLFIIAITLHNFPEGAAVGVSFGGGDMHQGLSTALGIGIQNMPEGLAVSAAMATLGYGRWPAFAAALASGLVEPVGGLIGASVVDLLPGALPWGLGLAAGAMIYVVTAEIIPETREKSKGEGSMIGLMIGLVGMMFLDIALG